MTTKKFAKQFERQCRAIVNISLEPIFGEYIITQNGKRIGVLFENRLYLLSTENLRKMVEGAIEENPFGWAYYRLILIEEVEDTELLKKAIACVYQDLYYHTDFVTDISYLFKANRAYPDLIVEIYNLHITFLRFCYEHKILKLNPLDKQGRILHFNFENKDLTETGAAVFNELYHKWLVYTDKNDEKSQERNNNVKILEKYYAKICKEKGL